MAAVRGRDGPFAMMSNLDRYKKDLESLIALGQDLLKSIHVECYPEQFKLAVKKKLGAKANEFIASLPPFKDTYQRWYSEALALVRQLLPDRLADFVQHYNKPKARKDFTAESYRIEDYFHGLVRTRPHDNVTVVGPASAIPARRTTTGNSQGGESTV